MSDVFIEKINEVYLKIHCDKSTALELRDHFTYQVPGYKWTPAGRRGWNGKISLFDMKKYTMLGGLRQEVERFCLSRNYKVEYLSDFSEKEFSIKEGHDFTKSLNLPKDRILRDYQLEAVVKCIRQKRRLTILPTGSGKSLVLYVLSCFYKENKLIITPNLNLIHQLTGDFISYGCDEKRIHKIYERQEKESNCNIHISTWQSLKDMPEEFFNQYGVVIVDECHLAKARSIVGIMNKLKNCQYRFGFSGTLDGTLCNESVLTGLFGPIKHGVTTKELIKRETLSPLSIKMIVLIHPRTEEYEYRDEIEYIIGCEKRNRFIKNLALSLEGNTLILFQYVEKHGELLHNMVAADSLESRKIFFVHGKVPGEERDTIRCIVEQEKNAIIVASRQTFGTGVNIEHIHNIIFASPLKSKIANLQAIGRGLRRADGKEECVLYDICDNLGWYNYGFRHAHERMKIYKREGFNYKTYSINMEG